MSEIKEAAALTAARKNELHSKPYQKGKPPSTAKGKLLAEVRGLLCSLHNPFVSESERDTYQQFFRSTIHKLTVLTKGQVRL